MSEEKKKEEGDAKAEEKPAAPKGPSAVGGILKILIPAILAAGASYGGTRYAKAQNAIVVIKEKEESEHKKVDGPPGPTLSLEPFLLSVMDAQKKPHPMKLTVAVEFSEKAGGGGGEHGGGGDVKVYMPRIRDVVLTFLRSMSYEQITDPSHFDTMRKELLEKCKDVGAEGATKVLVTDFVIQ